MTEAPAGVLPSLEEAHGWIGFDLDDVGGNPVGRVEGLYTDERESAPVWLVVTAGRRRRAKTIVVPLRECAAMPGRVWTAQSREAMRDAPAVDPTRPLLREHEAAICAHYGIGERVGRHAEVAGRPGGTVTARPTPG
jgi:hypothetical protein